MVRVSVTIPAYNCAKYLPEALESAMAQTYRDFEIIVVDDGSSDNTKSVVSQYQKKFPCVKYIFQENRGLAAARNTAIRNSSGELIALLDADDVWLPRRLEREVAAMAIAESIGLVHGNITRINENDEILDTPNRNINYLSGYIFDYLFLRKAHISCPTVLFRKSCCEKVGMFDEHLSRLGCEDRDLWLRIAKQYRVCYIDEVLAYYRIRKSSMSRDGQKMLTARRYVIDKYADDSHKYKKLRKLALAKIYKDTGDNLLLNKNFKAAASAYIQSLKYWPFSFWSLINLIKSVLRIYVNHTK